MFSHSRSGKLMTQKIHVLAHKFWPLIFNPSSQICQLNNSVWKKAFVCLGLICRRKPCCIAECVCFKSYLQRCYRQLHSQVEKIHRICSHCDESHRDFDINFRSIISYKQFYRDCHKNYKFEGKFKLIFKIIIRFPVYILIIYSVSTFFIV